MTSTEGRQFNMVECQVQQSKNLLVSGHTRNALKLTNKGQLRWVSGNNELSIYIGGEDLVTEDPSLMFELGSWVEIVEDRWPVLTEP